MTTSRSIAAPMLEQDYRQTESFQKTVRERLDALNAYIASFETTDDSKFFRLLDAYKAELQRMLSAKPDTREDVKTLAPGLRLARAVSKQFDSIAASDPDLIGDYLPNRKPTNGAEQMLFFAAEAYRQFFTSLENLRQNLGVNGRKWRA